jgi:hypothetical protein
VVPRGKRLVHHNRQTPFPVKWRMYSCTIGFSEVHMDYHFRTSLSTFGASYYVALTIEADPDSSPPRLKIDGRSIPVEKAVSKARSWFVSRDHLPGYRSRTLMASANKASQTGPIGPTGHVAAKALSCNIQQQQMRASAVSVLGRSGDARFLSCVSMVPENSSIS